MMINNYAIKNYGEPYIIAELGSNHNGDMKLAKQLILKAKEAGCHCVKFQSWSKETIFSKKVYEDNYFLADDYRNRTDYTLEQIVEEFSISEQELYSMKAFCDEIDIDFASTPFSKKEVDFLVDVCKSPFIKVASMDLNNYDFLDYIARKNMPIILSTGLSELHEIDRAISTIERTGNNKIIILHCVSVYPPDMCDVNLRNIEMLRITYPEYPIGFSDHTLGITIPLAAVALGACVIEKHFTLDKNMFGWDHKVSADFNEMKAIVEGARDINIALGSTRRIVGRKEMNQREAFRRSIVAARDIPQGKIIERNDLDIKRPGTGIEPQYIDMLIGKVAKRNIGYDELIKMEDF